jgi:hypothetical protein
MDITIFPYHHSHEPGALYPLAGPYRTVTAACLLSELLAHPFIA